MTSTPSPLQPILEEIDTTEFAARLAAAKLESYAAEQEGRDIPIEALVKFLQLPADLIELLLAWNVANARAGEIIEAMRQGRQAEAQGARH